MESSMVIKVKYGDTLRRFNVCVDENEKLDLDIDGLRAKIIGLFNFPQDADLGLTYIDEDGDMVTLVDDNDLLDAMKQRLKFLRIDIQLKNEKFGKAFTRSSGSSTPLRSPRVQHPLTDINNKVAEALKAVPMPLLETLLKLSLDLTSKASSSSPIFADLAEGILKLGISQLNEVPQFQADAESSGHTGASENFVDSSVLKDPNAPRGGGLRKVSLNSKPMDLNTMSSEECDAGNSVGVLAPAVNLNTIPQIGSVPSGSSNVIHVPNDIDILPPFDRNEAKNIGGQHIGKFDVSLAPTRPSDADQPHAMGLGGNASNESPFSGAPVLDDSTGTYRQRRICHLNMNRNATVGTFHSGIQCDGCGVHPITGPRFKSKVKDNYDLCSICFAAMGNENDYIRLDKPVYFPNPRPFRGSYDHRQNYRCLVPLTPRNGFPTPPPMMRHIGIKDTRPKLDSRFILDVNVSDGTIMAPSTPFTKIWRMCNSGTQVWPQGTQLVWIGGDRFSNAVSVDIKVPAGGLPLENELDISVDFTAPKLPGHYISYWRVTSPSGLKFGQRVWVLIQVDGSLKEGHGVSFQGLNLNLPPESNCPKSLEIIDMNVDPIVDGSLQGPCNSYPVIEPVKPVVEKKPKEENSPINDGSLVGNGGSASAQPLPRPPSSVLYPIIDLTDVDLAEASHSSTSLTTLPISSEEISDKYAVEQTLLKELEEMGFKQVDLNKEILRKNEYDLEQSVDDLCGISEWDPMLELQGMGFCDEEMNRRLLEKNNGSIKRVVMDLLTGEKA
ncbi:protein NBR1 homolog [Mangifera indica]|uniref:protein NBR1 homolog n=1 Tax=Mangifera indica TaxID=29780 RepID=UPI001CFB36B9|nr:protein NBR1 homolog [Mangifera indica]